MNDNQKWEYKHNPAQNYHQSVYPHKFWWKYYVGELKDPEQRNRNDESFKGVWKGDQPSKSDFFRCCF